MNKTDLIEAVAKATGLSKTQSADAIEAFVQTVVSSLKKKNDVKMVGFGTFSVSKRKATTGRNPRTGESIKIPAMNQPKFKAGKNLKDSVQ